MNILPTVKSFVPASGQVFLKDLSAGKGSVLNAFIREKLEKTICLYKRQS